MGLMEQIKEDIESITSDLDGFAVVLVFKSPNGDEATITGLHADVSKGYDENGPIIGKYTHVSFSEKHLTDLNYPTRNPSNGLLSMNNHLVTVSYAEGHEKQYVVDGLMPDYTINLHTLILSEYNGLD